MFHIPVPVSASSSGDNELVAAVSGKKIKVLSYTLIAAAAVSARFESSAGGTALTGQMPFGANGGAHTSFTRDGHFETLPGEALNLELSGSVLVAGHLLYMLD